MTSVYELLTLLSVVRKQKFWDYFDGDALKSWWNFANGVGSGSSGMVDAKNEGFQVTTGGTSLDWSLIAFNNIRQFDFGGAIAEFSCRAVSSVTRHIDVGFSGDATDFDIATAEFVMSRNDTQESFYSLRQVGGGSDNEVNTTLAIDEVFHTHKLSIDSVLSKLWIDGKFLAINSVDLPTGKAQPYFRVRTRGTGAKEGRIRYMECLNTE